MSKPSFRPSARLGFALASCLAFASFGIAGAVTKMKLRGYLTARAEANTVLILEDRIELTSSSRVLSKDASGEHPFDAQALSPGMLVEAEGQWLDKHRFFAESSPSIWQKTKRKFTDPRICRKRRLTPQRLRLENRAS